MSAASCSSCSGAGWPVRSLSARRGTAGQGGIGVGMLGALVGYRHWLWCPRMLWLATPTPAPSTSIPEAIATAVLVEAGTLLLPVSVRGGLPNRVKRPSCQLPGWKLAAS